MIYKSFHKLRWFNLTLYYTFISLLQITPFIPNDSSNLNYKSSFSRYIIFAMYMVIQYVLIHSKTYISKTILVGS